MKILFVWSGLTGYMGDCWRELAGRPDMELKVVVDVSQKYFGGAFHAEDVLRDLDWSAELPLEWRPDIIFTVGWHNQLCRSATLNLKWKSVPKVCCFDMPWRWNIRCFVARFVLWPYLRRFNAAFIPGQAADRYAHWLGFKHIYHGLFSTNMRRFRHHCGGAGFLYVGRDVHDKGTDILREAHELYRSQGGKLPLKIVSGVDPDQLGEIYSEADCFVLASRWEPWGVVLAEAAAVGLPIICTDKCGARHEVVREGVNGLIVKSGSAGDLAIAMNRIGELNGAVGREMADNYSCEAWADRVVAIVREIVVGC